MKSFRTLSNTELLRFAEQDPRYQADPLFTELAVRVAGASPSARRPADYTHDSPAPELVDVRQ